MTQNGILLRLAKLFLDGKMFGKGDGFPDIAETPSQRDFHAMIYYDYRQSAKLPKLVKLLWGPVSSDRSGRFVTVATEQNVASMKCLIKEDPRLPENETKDSLNLSWGHLDRIFPAVNTWVYGSVAPVGCPTS